MNEKANEKCHSNLASWKCVLKKARGTMRMRKIFASSLHFDGNSTSCALVISLFAQNYGALQMNGWCDNEWLKQEKKWSQNRIVTEASEVSKARKHSFVHLYFFTIWRKLNKQIRSQTGSERRRENSSCIFLVVGSCRLVNDFYFKTKFDAAESRFVFELKHTDVEAALADDW